MSVMRPKKANWEKLFQRKVLRNNYIAMFIINSVTGFSMYLIGYYVKYFPGTIYTNMAILGIADTLAAIYMYVIGTTLKEVPTILRFLLSTTFFLSIVYSVMHALGHQLLLGFVIGMIRLSVTSTQCYSLDMTSYCFPVSLRTTAFSLI